MRRDLALAKDYAHRHQVARYSNNAEDIINDASIDAVLMQY